MLRALGVAALVVLCACGGADANESRSAAVLSASPRPAGDSTALASALAGRRVYFAHQSVGTNIVAGLEKLVQEQPGLGITTVATRDPSVLSARPAFVHFIAGRNGDPGSKNADFLRLLDKRPTRDNGIALLKYCYVDATAPQSAAEIFAEYQRTVAAARARHPDLTIVHVTMPLMTVQAGPKASLKRLIGGDGDRQMAIKRHQFNTLMRSAYATREPLFDIADVESRRANGALAFFVAGDDTIPTLAAEYTWDGGHLNEYAQRIAARRLLEVLSRVAATR